MSPRALFLPLAAALWLVAAAPPLHAQVTETGVTLGWTAVGDDSLTGQAARYDLRWSLAPISSLAQFALATPVSGLASPQPSGTAETAVVTGLTPATTYWFTLRTFDESGNGSALSNLLQVTTLASTDLLRPAPIALSIAATTNTSVTLGWTDVGDDSLTGTATSVEIRWATAPITDANWANATTVFGVPAPGPPGTPHQLLVPGLDRTRDLWFAARAHDDVNRVSTVGSPLLVPHLLDTAPPAAPAGLTATVEPPAGVHVRWAANAEPDLAGYNVYRALASNGSYTRLTSSIVVSNEYVDANTPDTLSVWYEVTAVDATGNESARSAAFRVFLQGAGIAAWDMGAPYPNPSRASGPVTLPFEVPGAGPYDAVVEIQDAAGQHVRSLRLANVSPGPVSLVWDGRNEDGRATVPGVYRAWLRAGDHRVLVRIMRTP